MFPPYSLPTPLNSPPPSYSTFIGTGELQVHPDGSTLNSAFNKSWGSISLSILDQSSSTLLAPRFSAGALIRGVIKTNPSTTTQVAIELQGLMTLGAPSGSTNLSLFHDKQRLLAAGSPQSTGQIPFSFRLPTGYTNAGRQSPLPPTFEEKCLDPGKMFVAKCAYTLTLFVQTRQLLGTKSESFVVPLNYEPYTASLYAPSLVSPHFFSSVKNNPQAWLEVTNEIKLRSTHSPLTGVAPIAIHVRNAPTAPPGLHTVQIQWHIPSAESFDIRDTIPFHVRLVGTFQSLRLLFASNPNSTWFAKTNTAQPSAIKVQIRLIRRISVILRENVTTREIIIGGCEGAITQTPPRYNDDVSSTSSNAALDWEGRASCRTDVDCGGFNTSNLVVQDLVELYVSPLYTATSPYRPIKIDHPITLVNTSSSVRR